jgi:hypothetical protein
MNGILTYSFRLEWGLENWQLGEMSPFESASWDIEGIMSPRIHAAVPLYVYPTVQCPYRYERYEYRIPHETGNISPFLPKSFRKQLYLAHMKMPRC